MTVITDLRREVKERLESQSITDLTEMKLKQVDLDTVIGTKAITSKLNQMLIKIGKSLIKPILLEDISNDDKFRKIEEIVNIGDFKISLEEVEREDDENKELVDLLNNVSKNKANEDILLKIVFSDKKEDVFTYSWLNFDAKTSNEGFYKFRTRGAKSYPIVSIFKLVGIAFLSSGINKYYKTNKEMAQITILKYAGFNGIYRDEEQLEELTELGKALNITVKNKVKYASVFGYDEEKIARYQLLNHIDWLKTEEFFTISSLYGLETSRSKSLNILKNPDLVVFFANFLIELNKEEENNIKANRKLASDYATSFQTKKNIPKVIADKMETTSFLNHFGYVEFDESVDLEKIEQIEREWEEVNTKIAFPVSKNHSLRFRRLGNHKAGGLYFPAFNTVCVDLGSPSSMIHEVLHMIDYSQEGTRSSSYKFRGIIETYKTLTNSLVKDLDSDDDFKKSWNGNSKFNKEYFQNAKEIFARCGEIYIKQILKVDTSLVKGDSNDIIYPKDDVLFELIENYFKYVIDFARINSEKTSPKKIVEEPIKEIETEILNVADVNTTENIQKDGQFKMF